MVKGSGDREKVERIYGLAAAQAVLAVRPEQVLRIAYTERARRPLAELLRAAAKRRIAYRELDDDELTKMAGAVHHEGVCVLARPAPEPTVNEQIGRASCRERGEN